MLAGGGHVIGVGALALVSLWWQLRDISPGVISWASQRGYSFTDSNSTELGAHLALCALVWVSGCAAWTYGVKRRKVSRVRLARARRGSVMLEALIAIPVFLVLMCGLVQMTLLNIAVIMTDVAAIQAGRTAYVWHGEIGLPVARSSGYGVPSRDAVVERARTVATGVLASVAPGTNSDWCASSSTFNQYMTGMNNGMSINGATLGVNLSADNGLIRINSLLNSGGLRDRNMADAFDSGNFDFRAALKLATAYCNTTVTYEVAGDVLKTTVSYKHKLTIPITGFAFSNVAAEGPFFNRKMYTKIDRTYVLPAPGVTPNPYTPVSLMSGILDLNPFG